MPGFVVDTWPYKVSGFQTFGYQQIDEVIEACRPHSLDVDHLSEELALPMDHWGPLSPSSDRTMSHIRWIVHPTLTKNDKDEVRAVGPDVFKLGAQAVYTKIVMAYHDARHQRRSKYGGTARW